MLHETLIRRLGDLKGNVAAAEPSGPLSRFLKSDSEPCPRWGQVDYGIRPYGGPLLPHLPETIGR